MKYFKYLGTFLLLLFPITVVAYGKPLKILVPEIAGVECYEKSICVDDISKLSEATALYEKSIKVISNKLSPISSEPTVVFCSTENCFSSFGFNNQAAVSIASVGIVISPRGWKDHYVTHELIHQWQSDKYGVISSWLAPTWIKEGMAYYLSNDPREVLSEPFQSYRNQYKKAFGALRGSEIELTIKNRI